MTAPHTGLRAGESSGLQRSDVKVAARSGHVAVWGKGHRYREVPLNRTAREALGGYLATLPPEATLPLPLDEGGGPITERALGYIVTTYASLAKVADISPHDLRRRFGYRMARTVPLHRLAQLMGHDSLDTTLLYVSGTKQDLQQAVEEIAWA